MHPHAALCHRFLDAIEAGEVDAAIACYAPGAVIWHNTDELETDVAANRAVLEAMIPRLPERRYTQRRVIAHDGGFIEQHVLTGTLADGAGFRLPASLICDVRDGRITRLDEYYDSAAVTRRL